MEALFPKRCIICNDFGDFLCAEHSSDVFFDKNISFLPDTDISVWSVTDYNHKTVKKLLENWKYEGQYGISDFLAKKLSDFHNFGETPVFIPVPLHWTRKIWRGWNQASSLCSALAKENNGSVKKLLIRVKKTHQQAKLNKKEREMNTRGAFMLKKNVKVLPNTVFLVDDVFTTGSTLKNAAKALENAGIKNIMAVVFAHVD